MPTPTGTERTPDGRMRIDYDDGTFMQVQPVIPVAQDGTIQSSTQNAGGGGGGGGGAVTVANGADTAEGSTTDVAVTSDANGTISGKLRGLVKILADVWDSVGHTLKISAAALPLPTGAATSAGQATGNSSLASMVTNTTGLAQESGGNLATVATNTALAAIGSAGNLWNAASVAANGTSAPIQLTTQRQFAIHGTTDGGNSIVLAISVDNGASDPYTAIAQADVPVGKTNFAFSGTLPVGTWVQLLSVNASTTTAALLASA
jgi:hypothetical protein